MKTKQSWNFALDFYISGLWTLLRDKLKSERLERMWHAVIDVALETSLLHAAPSCPLQPTLVWWWLVLQCFWDCSVCVEWTTRRMPWNPGFCISKWMEMVLKPVRWFVPLIQDTHTHTHWGHADFCLRITLRVHTHGCGALSHLHVSVHWASHSIERTTKPSSQRRRFQNPLLIDRRLPIPLAGATHFQPSGLVQPELKHILQVYNLPATWSMDRNHDVTIMSPIA